MKTLKSLALISMVISSHAFAMDFNSIIKENSKAQNDLHDQIRETVNDSKIAAQNSNEGSNVIADNATTVHVNTRKDMLTFAKEKKHSTASQQQNDKRLAQEIKDLE